LDTYYADKIYRFYQRILLQIPFSNPLFTGPGFVFGFENLDHTFKAARGLCEKNHTHDLVLDGWFVSWSMFSMLNAISRVSLGKVKGHSRECWTPLLYLSCDLHRFWKLIHELIYSRRYSNWPKGEQKGGHHHAQSIYPPNSHSFGGDHR
jgi:hypothetical protein